MNTVHQPVADEDLARQTQAGSLQAFEQLVYRYESRLLGYVARWSRSEADARDAAQDAFVRAFEAIAQYDSRYPFRVWLFAIARRKCIDRHRAARALERTPAPELHEPVDTDDPAELLARREDQLDLWRVARGALSLAQFEALWLRYAEDMTVAEIARVLRKTQTHVKVLLFRARRALARELQRTKAASGALGRLPLKSRGVGSASPQMATPSQLDENPGPGPLRRVSLSHRFPL